MTRLAAGIYETLLGDTRLTITDVTAHTGRLDAWVEVHHGKRRLTFGDYNLRGARTVSGIAKSCAEAMPSLKVPWLEWVGEAVYEAIADTLEGSPPVELTTRDARPPGWIVENLVGDVGATSLVGFGETGKSMIALAAACTIASGDDVWLGLRPFDAGPVLYLDWEASADPHQWRLTQLCEGARREPPRGLFYRREGLPLFRSITAITRHAHHLGVKLVIVDSVMLARGGDAFGPESTTTLYAALAQIGIPALLVDHRAKHSGTNGDSGPYGSVANLNSLRLCWGVTTQSGTEGVDIRLKRVKANYHGGLRDHEWRLRFFDENRSARFEQMTPGSILVGEPTSADRILGALRRAGMAGHTVKTLAAETGMSDAAIRARLSELRKQGRADQVGGVWMTDDRQEEAPF